MLVAIKSPCVLQLGAGDGHLYGAAQDRHPGLQFLNLFAELVRKEREKRGILNSGLSSPYPKIPWILLRDGPNLIRQADLDQPAKRRSLRPPCRPEDGDELWANRSRKPSAELVGSFRKPTLLRKRDRRKSSITARLGRAETTPSKVDLFALLPQGSLEAPARSREVLGKRMQKA